MSMKASTHSARLLQVEQKHNNNNSSNKNNNNKYNRPKCKYEFKKKALGVHCIAGDAGTQRADLGQERIA